MTKMFENAVEKARETIPYAYDISLPDMQYLLREGFSGDRDRIYSALIAAFHFGFAMGNRATHSRKLRRL